METLNSGQTLLLASPFRRHIVSVIQTIIARWNPRGLLRLAWLAHRLLLGKGKQIYWYRNRFRFVCDRDSLYSVLAAYGVQHRAVERLLTRLIPYCSSEINFFDVGANIGFVSLLACSLFPEQVHAYCFEPNPIAMDDLMLNVGLNQFRITLNGFALGDVSGLADMIMGVQTSNSTLVAGGIPQVPVSGTKQVMVSTLDDYCEEQAIVPQIVKVDVEGFEQMVLRGGLQVIQRVRPFLIIEVNPRTLASSGFSSIELLSMLCELGYRVFYIDPKQTKLSKRELNMRSKWHCYPEVMGKDCDGRHLFDILAVPIESSIFNELL